MARYALSLSLSLRDGIVTIVAAPVNPVNCASREPGKLVWWGGALPSPWGTRNRRKIIPALEFNWTIISRARFSSFCRVPLPPPVRGEGKLISRKWNGRRSERHASHGLWTACFSELGSWWRCLLRFSSFRFSETFFFRHRESDLTMFIRSCRIFRWSKFWTTPRHKIRNIAYEFRKQVEDSNSNHSSCIYTLL